MRRYSHWVRVLALSFGIVCVVFLDRTFAAESRRQERPPKPDLRSTVDFSIAGGPLSDALARFSEQSGWQIAYDPAQIRDLQVGELSGRLSTRTFLERLLSGTGLVWRAIGATIVVRPDAHANHDDALERTDATFVDDTTAFSDIEVVDDAFRTPAYETSSLTFGFDKPLMETPRSISVIGESTIDLFDLSAVEDLVRVVPGVYTTTRFGIQGSVDIRNVPADTYFRGVKRLTLQGHGRSVLAAMDTIEVVGGPASPLYGMGKIGGYTNMVPKSGRAKTGGYLTELQGFFQASFGSYQRAELSFGIGGPADSLQRFDKRGGYYVYGLLEDSLSYTDGVPIKQRILQAAISIDEFAGSGRLEAGASYQYSATAGALTGRFTQDLVDSGRYLRGIPLVNLDLNGNGTIGYLEMQRGSPVQGLLGANNQPLLQTWNWPLDANGNPLPLGQFPIAPGIPQSLYDYLVAHPEADPTGLLRAQGVGGPRPQSGYVPIGMALDPRTIGYDTLNFHRASAFERELQAHFLTLFADLIFDDDPNRTFKNQLFFDGMDQYKTSNQPFSTTQIVYVWEDKLTATWRWQDPPNGLRLNSLAAINYRNTISRGRSLFGDFSTHRTDAMAPTWIATQGGMTPNSTFANGYDNPDLASDGYPWGGDYRTKFSEFGLGLLFDIDVGRSTNILLGGRFDASQASNIDYAGSFNAATGTSANPGRYTTSDVRAEKWDQGISWNISVSQQLPGNVRPYATYAQSSIVLDANNNALTNVIINAGHIGSATLAELGAKASLWSDRIFIAAAGYEQMRTDAEASDEPGVINAYATATRTRGVEAQFKIAPTQRWQLSLYGLQQRTYYEPNIGAILLVDARALGFQDIRDAQGRIIYPAEAFLYGGRSRIALPPNVAKYAEKQGNPHLQLGLTTVVKLRANLAFTFSGNHFSETCTGRICLVRLPDSSVFSAGLLWSKHDWQVKFDVLNLTDERYFRARTGETLGDVLAQAMPERHWQFTIKKQY
jgi:outer membrane receptor protein involved in Fe transport